MENLQQVNRAGIFGHVVTTVERGIHAVSLAAITIMMVILTADALGRSMFSSPIPGVMEITEGILMPTIVFLSMSTVFARKGHVSMEIVVTRLSARVRHRLEILTTCLGIPLFTAMAYAGTLMAHNAMITGRYSTGVVAFPLWIPLILVPIGTGTTTLRLCLQLITLLAQREYVTELPAWEREGA